MSEIECDRSYWPEGGTMIVAIPADLNTLWESHADQASIFVAEALISESDSINARVDLDDTPSVEVYLWTAGGDTLTISFDLSAEIDDAVSEYVVRSEEQAMGALDGLRGLQALEDTVRQAKSKLEDALAEFRKEAKNDD